MEMDEKSDRGSSRESTPVLPETLIAGRQKRSTAGNRLAQLLEQEQPDDIDLLFEEDGEDDDFEAKHESDVDLGSSSDEEDKPQEQDELAGEKELEKAERETRKKRKTADAFPNQKQLDKLIQRQQGLRNKRVTIQEPDESKDDSMDASTDERPRKKSERISWIPTQEDQPSRQSSRRQTVANKQMIHERMKESNERRLKVIAAMTEASQKKKEKHVEMTQEMRLARAQKVEEHNKKSLNKWQVAEEARLAAQRAKIAALHNRKITGPIIKFYSGRAEWDGNGKLIRLGNKDLLKEVPKKEEVKKPVAPEPATSKTDATGNPEAKDTVMEVPKAGTPEATNGDTEVIMTDVVETNTANVDASESTALEANKVDIIEPSMDGNNTAEIAVAEKNIDNTSDIEMGDAKEADNGAAEAKATNLEAHNEQNPTEEEPTGKPPLKVPATGVTERISVAPPSPTGFDDDDTQNQIAEQLQGDLDAASRSSKPIITNQIYVVLQNFKKDAVSSKEVQGKILFPHNQGPLPRPDRPLCVTTNLPARFRDPVTGLPYASLFGYKQIQRVKKGDLRWNSTLQCFFDGQEAASGVPEGFY